MGSQLFYATCLILLLLIMLLLLLVLFLSTTTSIIAHLILRTLHLESGSCDNWRRIYVDMCLALMKASLLRRSVRSSDWLKQVDLLYLSLILLMVAALMLLMVVLLLDMMRSVARPVRGSYWHRHWYWYRHINRHCVM